MKRTNLIISLSLAMFSSLTYGDAAEDAVINVNTASCAASNASGNQAIAIGCGANSSGTRSTSIGNSATAGATADNANNYRVKAFEELNRNNTFLGIENIGKNSIISKVNPEVLLNGSAIAVYENGTLKIYKRVNGVKTNQELTNAEKTALYQDLAYSGESATAMGNGAQAVGWGATAYGTQASALNTNTNAIGNNARAMGYISTALGTSAITTGTYSLAMGTNAAALANNSIAVGTQAVTANTGANAIGYRAYVSGLHGTAIGTYAMAITDRSVALGVNSIADVASNVLGYNPISGTTYTEAEVTDLINQGGDAATYKSSMGAVAVGRQGMTRQITYVAAGTQDTDAVNVAQLKQVRELTHSQLDNVANRINTTDKRVHEMKKEMRGIGASAAAGMSLPQAYQAGDSMVSAAVGGYKNASAVAVGWSHVTDNNKRVIKFTATANSNGDISGGAGIGFRY